MIRAKSLLILTLLCAAIVSAQPKWIHVANENFRVYSSANDRDTRAALNNLERVRGFFNWISGTKPKDSVPIYVVIFNSEKEYAPFKPKEFAAAYYSSGTDRDYIVFGKMGDEAVQVANHEYTHLVFRHAGYTLPPWLNEGIADLFSTVKPLAGDSTEFGNILIGRLQQLSRESWVPLSTILAADHDSPYYSETKKAGMLYAEGWALVHMLATGDEYRPKFWDFVNTVQAGTPSQQALERIYSIPFAKIEADLKFYIRSDRFKKLVAKFDLPDTAKLKTEPASLFDVRTLQADLLANSKEGAVDAKMRYLELTREDAARPEPWSGLAYLSWREGNIEEALGHFAKAYDAGDRNRRLLNDYGRMVAGRDATRGSLVLGQLLEVEPGNFEARLTLASLQSTQQKYAEALATIKAITSVKTEAERDRVLFMRASIALRANDREEARARAEELKRNSKDATILSRADEILRFLDQPQRPVMPQFAPPPPREEPVVNTDERPKLTQRTTEPVTRADMEIILQDVRGTLVEMDCKTPPRMILQTDQGKLTFLVLQPDRLIVTGSQSGGAEFTCGPQAKPAPIRLQFTIAPEGSDAAGVVRAVHFGN